MRLAVNYSEAARSLLREGEIAFDLWKCAPLGELGGIDNLSADDPPGYVHFPLDAGAPDFLDTDWSALERTLDATRTPFVNVHLNATKRQFPGCSDEDARAAIRDRFRVALELLATRFGAERVLAENVVYRGPAGNFLRPSVEPDLISEVVRDSGVRFLLDTAHATITCEGLSLRVEEYIAALPVDRLGELHVTGVSPVEGRLRDSMPMTDRDRTLAGWVLQRIHSGEWPDPWLVALEYGGVGPIFEWRTDPEVLRRDLIWLRQLAQPES